MPKVTVGITAFNAQHTLAAAVQSALNQTHKDIEIIIVDDVSTDGTRALIDQLQQQHPQLRVILNEKNVGVAANRNAIVQAASGDFIAFFDDDDTSLPMRIERQLQAIQQAEAAYGANALAVCHTARTQVFPDGHTAYCSTLVGTPAPRGLAVAMRILVGKPVPRSTPGAMATCSQMARTNTYRTLGGFDASLRRSEDTDFNIRLALAGGYFVGLPEALVTQTMTLRQDKSWQDEHRFALLLLDKHKDAIASAGFAGFAPAWADMKLAFLEGRYTAFASSAARITLRWPWQTLQRISWVLPNVLENLKIGRFRRGLNCL